jgi:hypothetical protein
MLLARYLHDVYQMNTYKGGKMRDSVRVHVASNEMLYQHFLDMHLIAWSWS